MEMGCRGQVKVWESKVKMMDLLLYFLSELISKNLDQTGGIGLNESGKNFFLYNNFCKRFYAFFTILLWEFFYYNV